MATSKVWAGKVDTYNRVVTDDAICLGMIEFDSLPEAFIKTLRLYNKNASKHLYDPQFMFKGKVYVCEDYGVPSKTGRGYTRYWTLASTTATNMPVTFSDYEPVKAGGKVRIKDHYLLSIPKSKVNDRNWLKYIE